MSISLDSRGYGVSHLSLWAFRNHSQRSLSLHSPFVLLTGPNGSGKTNILEALSFLVPGKGLRSALLSDIPFHAQVRPSSSHPQSSYLQRPQWAVHAQLGSPLSPPITIGTGVEVSPTGQEKRIFRLNNSPLRLSHEIHDLLGVVWVTPEMDFLFQGPSSGRRRWIDRMATLLDPTHSARLHRYDHALRERSLLLRKGQGLLEKGSQESWLRPLESTLAHQGVAICQTRCELVSWLMKCQPEDYLSPFPRFVASMEGEMETWLRSFSSLEVEEKILQTLRERRSQDSLTGGASLGPHRSDLSVLHLEKKRPAPTLSTGEQRMMLLALFLAFTRLSLSLSSPPSHGILLLLDDVASHLDQHHLEALVEELCQTIQKGAKLQIWMTGTSADHFGSFIPKAQQISLTLPRESL